MDEREKQIRTRLKNDFSHYASKCLRIRTKAGDVLPFILSQGQLILHAKVEHQRLTTGRVRVIVVKGRQVGISTYIGGRGYWFVTHRRGVKAFILTHDKDATDNLFEMTQRYHDNCPAIVRPTTEISSSKELFFGGLDSGFKIGTAGNKGVGRSSTIQFFHGSEVSLWPHADEHSKGILQAVPRAPGTEVYLESTARGIGNYFHEQWQLAEAGQSDFIPVFIPWFVQNEYREEIPEDFEIQPEESELVKLYNLDAMQLMWRRVKIQEFTSKGGNGLISFHQEYPNNPTEAFQSSSEDVFIPPDLVMRARKSVCEGVGPLLIGVDPARFGDDRTSIVYRRGRKAYNLKSYSKKDTMEVVGIVHKIIKMDCPDRVFVDVGGLGAGVVDRLWELGFKKIVVAVNAGSSPLDADKYVNKRAEMWGVCKDWLTDGPVQIPDVDSLHADLCGVRYKFDSLTRLVIEPKDQMKKRGLRSPDESDALCLTFALPFDSIKSSANDAESVASEIMSASNNIMRARSRR